MTDETRRQIAECLELLRWSLAGARAGGVSAWPRATRETPEAPEYMMRDKQPAESQIGLAGARTEGLPPIPQPSGTHGPAASRQTHGTSGMGATEDRPRSETAPPAAAESIVIEDAREAHDDSEEKLAEICRSLQGCSRCRLHSGRTNLVFGEGAARSGIVFVGEGPGFDEDRQGRPFVGRAGKLLDKMIQAMGYQRSDVYICNVVKCRPPQNRTPQPDEAEACSPFLIKQIEALRPGVICALGACAAQSLLQSARPISHLRGKTHLWRGIPLICTYHPAYLLRNPVQKAATWQDLKEVLRIIRSGNT